LERPCPRGRGFSRRWDLAAVRSFGAVVIASSTDTHADLILGAAAASKAIFCEKPVDLDVERARKCAEAVSKAGVACMIGFNRRFESRHPLQFLIIRDLRNWPLCEIGQS
jgi:predicted dehydrogenase